MGAVLISLPLNSVFIFVLHDQIFAPALVAQYPWNVVAWMYHSFVSILVFLVVGAALLKLPLIAIEASTEVKGKVADLVRGNRLRMSVILCVGVLFYVGVLLSFEALNYAVAVAYSRFVSAEPEPPLDNLADTVLILIELQTVLWVAVTAVLLSAVCKKLMDNVSLSEASDTMPSQNEGSSPDTSSA